MIILCIAIYLYLIGGLVTYGIFVGGSRFWRGDKSGFNVPRVIVGTLFWPIVVPFLILADALRDFTDWLFWAMIRELFYRLRLLWVRIRR